MRKYPPAVTIVEVGPRDGFQLESKMIPTEIKLEIINGLIDAGLKHIQITSFVHPHRVPQMADAETLIRQLPQREDVIFSALALNTKGVERAASTGITAIEVSISASETHSLKNSGMNLDQGIQEGTRMIRAAKSHGMLIRAGIQCAFGCVYDGEIPQDRVMKIAGTFAEAGADTFSLADTTGMATPRLTSQLLYKMIHEFNTIPIGLHLHDTRGLGLVNFMEALSLGIDHFDTSLGGLGGCPFVTGAAGNIPTEDTAWLLKSLNIETGIHIEKVAKCSQRLETFLGRRLPGKMYRLF